MNKKVHTIAGVVPFVLLSINEPTGFEFMGATILPVVACLTSAVASPLPDLDLKPMHYSQGKKSVAKQVAKVKTKVVNKVTGGHRGITHTLLFPVLFLLILGVARSTLSEFQHLYNIVASLLFGVLSGWSLHIFADMFNGKGCPLLWPFIRKKIPGVDLPSEGIVPYIWLVAYTGFLYCLIFR